MPLLHGSPFFVDLTNIVLTILVVLAYYYSIKAFIWPYGDDDLVTDKKRRRSKRRAEAKKND